MPVWLQITLAIATIIETPALAILLWLGKIALSDRKIIIARLNEINGSVRKHTWWIDGHEEYTKDRDREVNRKFELLEQRERERFDGTDRRKRPRE